MSEGTIIRELNARDRDLYLTMAREFYHSDGVLHPVPDSHLEKTFRELLRSQTYLRCFFLEKDGAAGGFALLAFTFSQEAGGSVVWLEELYVREAFRGQGLASSFLSFMKSEIPAARYRLEIEPSNDGARRLYERHGFSSLAYQQMVLENN